MNRHVIKSLFRGTFKVLVIAFVIMPFFQSKVHGQAVGLSDLKAKFVRFRERDLQEKLYVHTNKDFYLAGEILWFKIYDMNEATNAPFNFSKVAYVELLDKNNMPVLQTKVALGNKGNGGSILLPFTLHSGNYLLRAYTSWMKNFLPDYYFEKTITIINTTKNNDFPPTDSMHYEVKFFPEGGDLVAGLRSEIGFRATDQYGNGTGFTGIIINQQHDTIIHFKPYKFGMGHFYFRPDKNEQYKAVIRLKNGQVLSIPLPAVREQGFVMHTQSISVDQLKITVHNNLADEKYCYLIIQTRGSVKAAEILFFNNGEASFTIDKDKLGEGISQLTIFDSRKQPVCERLYFRQPSRELVIHAETNHQQYLSRHEITLNFLTTDNKDKPVKAEMSVSVYKSDSLQMADRANILNYLWLSSELKGQIESPEYYFKNNYDSVEEAADNLMLTQGWRRFKWRDVEQNKLPDIQYIPELSGHLISGKVINSQTGLPVPDVLTYLSVVGKGAKVEGYMSDSAGRIYFNMKDFYGPHQIVTETNTQSRDSINRVEVLNPFSSQYSGRPTSSFSITSSLAEQLSRHNLWMQVQHAYHPDAYDHFASYPGDSSSFFGKPYKTYWLDNYTRYSTMEEVMKEYVQEVAVRISNKHYRLMVVDNYDKSLYASLFSDNPLVLLDGVPVFDMDKVIAFDPLKVQKLEIVAGRYFYGPIIADGILSYHTYKNNMENFPLNPHAVVIDYQGLQKEREFYLPEYESDSARTSSVPDFRNVLYWSPSITSNAQGKAQCHFYTSDLQGKYIVVINGITRDGEAGSSVSQFDVTGH